ncbi:MAG TPA: hypothetical protein VNZ53_55795 [Steroidobacteraceae bacterium]|jgi:hypothetical protein|nr:hypothetical protein [Steroidobacteraceae bacterium]
MPRPYPAFLLGATLLSLGACATTTFTSTWKAPDEQTINPAGKIIAAVFVSGDERNRHAAEDALARDLNARGAHGVPGYTLLPNQILGDDEDTFARLKEAGANEIVVMRVVGADRPPSFTKIDVSSFAGTEEPGRANWIRVNNVRNSAVVVSVETLVYSLNRDELLWSSTSRTTNPQDIAHLVNEVANASAKEMVKQGLLARQ